ncbi:MAG: HAMP domain-containing histidine kinase [Clostridia bacterium]|nr:HAMP domain-containing histidine kinase [Clostridia bacterium]
MKKLPKLSIRIRNVFLRVAVQLFLVIVVVAASIVFSNSVAIERIYTFAEIVNMESIRLKLDEVDPFSYEYFKQLALISDNNYYLIEVFDEAQNVVYSNSAKFLYSGEFSGDIDQVYAAGEVVRTMEWLREDVTLDKFSYGENDTSYVRYMVQLKNGDALRIWLPSFQVQRNAEVAAILLTAFALISGIATAVLILFFSRNFSHPVAEMSEMAESMANLDFGKKCKHYRQTDVQNLGKNINILSESLSQTLDELQDKNEKLTEELEHSALIDESRKSFIANVSHELKTPIAIIRGYAEGLRMGINSDPQGSEEYCDIILEESEKMNHIVMDLLNLEKIESGSYVPILEELNLSQMIEGQLAAFSMMFEEQDIKVRNLVPQDLIVHSDEKTILLVLQNFLSNAASNIGGKKIVQLSCEDLGKDYRISVYNSGEPIADSELDKIWYSFYKSDKKRKNEELHFGLGLPVVKATQKRLEKDCGVVNEHGGVRFWFDVGK